MNRYLLEINGNLKKTFTINGKVAKELNEKDVTLKENHSIYI